MTSFDGANILVVGGAGFVGSNLVRLLLEQGPARIVIVDNLLSADPSNVPNDRRGRILYLSDPSRTTPFSRRCRKHCTMSFTWLAITATNHQSPIRSPTTTTTRLRRLSSLRESRISVLFGKSFTRRRVVPLRKRLMPERRRPKKMRRSRCSMTVRIQSQSWLARCTEITISPVTKCLLSKRAFKMFGMGRARFWELAVGEERCIRSGATSRLPSYGRRCTARLSRSRTGASRRAISSSWKIWQEASSPAHCRVNQEKSIT